MGTKLNFAKLEGSRKITPRQHVSPETDGSNVVAILGMGGSGTSCLAGSLQQAGLYLGEKPDLKKGRNPKGNREHLRILQLNATVVLHNGGTDLNAHENLHWTRQMADRRDRIINYLYAVSGGTWGFKDPKTMLLLPFWQEAIPDLRFVGCYRHPGALVRSLLAKRSLTERGTTMERMINSWCYYNDRLLSCAREYQFPVLSFDAPGEEFLRCIRHVTLLLGLTPPTSSASGQFFEDRLRKHSPKPNEIPESSRARKIYRGLQDHYQNSMAQVL